MSKKNPYNNFDKYIQEQYYKHGVLPPSNMWNKIEAQLKDLEPSRFDAQIQEMFSSQPTELPANLWLKVEADFKTIDEEKKKKKVLFYWWLILWGIFILVGWAYFKWTSTNVLPIAQIPKQENISFHKSSLLKRPIKTSLPKAEQIEVKYPKAPINQKSKRVKEATSLSISNSSKLKNAAVSTSLESQNSIYLKDLINDNIIVENSSEVASKKLNNSILHSQKTTRHQTLVYPSHKTSSLETIQSSLLSYPKEIDDTVNYITLINPLNAKFQSNKSKFSITAILSPSYTNRIVKSNHSVQYPKHNGSFAWNIGTNLGIDINENISLSIGLHYNSYVETTKIGDKTKYNLPLEIVQGQNPTLITNTIYGASLTSLDSTSLNLFIPPPPPPPPPPPNPIIVNSSIPERFDYEEQFSIQALHLPLNFRYQWGHGKIKPIIDIGLEAMYIFQTSSILKLTPYLSSRIESIVSEQFHKIRAFNLSASLGVGVKYTIHSNWSMLFIPTFNLNLLDMNNQVGTEVYPYTLRFSTGVQYHF